MHRAHPDAWEILLQRTNDKRDSANDEIHLNLEMSRAYDVSFGIFSHSLREWTPLKMVAQHPAEDPWDYLGRKALVDQYLTYGLEQFCTLDGFMKMDFPLAEALVEKARKRLHKQSSDTEDEMEKLRQAEEKSKREREKESRKNG